MPNAKILVEKKKIVEELTEKLKSQAGVLVNYSGITVNEDTEMRVKMREANVDYTVIKNTLMKFAIKNVGFDELDPILNGTTSLAVSKTDPIAPARIIKEYADKFANYFEIKGGFMDGRVLSVSDVNALASIPALPILQAQLLGTMLAPIASLAVVLKAIAEKGVAPVDANLKASDEKPALAETVEETAPEASSEEPAPAESAAEAAPDMPAGEAEPVDIAVEAAQEVTEEEPVSEKKPAPAKAAAKTAPKKQAEDAAPADAAAEDGTASETVAKKPAAKKTAAKAAENKPDEEPNQAEGEPIAEEQDTAE